MNIALEKYRYYFETLCKNNLFKDVSPKSINSLLDISTPKIWPKQTTIADTEKTLFTFYIVISGKIKAYNFDQQNNRQLTLFILSRNDVFDLCTLMNGCLHDIYYETLDQTEVLAIPLFKMKKWMSENTIVINSFFGYIINKMQRLEEYVIDVSLEDTPTRLAKLLIKNMNTTSNKIELINDLSHRELAQLIGTTRAVINRHIQEFKKDGILKVERKYIEILDIKALLNKTNGIRV